jgi:hypothetical protein
MLGVDPVDVTLTSAVRIVLKLYTSRTWLRSFLGRSSAFEEFIKCGGKRHEV